MELSEQNGGSRFGGRGGGVQSDRSNATDKRPAEEDVMSVIGTGIVVTGNIEAEVDLHIEGSVIGDVRCATLILGERGSVTGSVFAERVRVSGAIEGGIEATDLAVEACAKVKGDVTYSRLRVANGGVISGTMTHKPVEETSKLTLVEAAIEVPPKVHFIE
jgi:cytoskeletal protein CcmA (bactofilin family)